MDNNILKNTFKKYNINKTEQKEIYDIIKNLFLHKEFQRRLTNEFLHHGKITLGQHILEDTILTYKYCKKSKKKIDIECALKISMMHDLYTLPWQNSGIKTNSFFYKHGFRHPIEAAINSLIWFKDEFNDQNKNKIIIDGIVHHMYPLPVMSFSDLNKDKILNNNLIKNISKENLNILIDSSNRNKIGKVSISKSKYIEGRIMMKADKKVSLSELNNIYDIFALFTGKNKSIKK